MPRISQTSSTQESSTESKECVVATQRSSSSENQTMKSHSRSTKTMSTERMVEEEEEQEDESPVIQLTKLEVKTMMSRII